MPHYYPVVFPAGRSLAGDSLGFHAYSFRVDNCTNQWYLEESTVSYIPPYSLGMCLRLYGTGVAILLAQAPVGQPQLAPIAGEQVVGVYSDQLRTEVAASPIRNFALVQTVSDLTEGPQPARPPTGTDRLYADASGNIHHLHSDGTDLTLVDPSNAGTLLYPTFDPHYQALMNATALGGDLWGPVSAGHVAVRNMSTVNGYDGGGTSRPFYQPTADNYNAIFCSTAGLVVVNSSNTVRIASMDNSGALSINGGFTCNGLDVHTGDAHIDAGSLYVSNQVNAATLAVSGNAATGPLTVTGGETVSGTLNVASNASTGPLTVNGAETVTGLMTANNVYSQTNLQAAGGYCYLGSGPNTYLLGTSTQLLLRSSSGQTYVQDDSGAASDLFAKDVQLNTGAVIAQSSAVAQLIVRPAVANAGLMVWDGQVANSGTVIHALPGISGAQPMGFLFVANINTGTGAIYYFYGGGQFVVLVYGAGGQWSATLNNTGTNNVYWSGTDYVLQNNTASAGNYVGQFLRTA